MAKTYISPQRFYRILHRIADRNIGRVESAFMDAVRITRDDINEGELARALLDRNVVAAFDAVGLNGQLEARTKSHMQRALASMFVQASGAASAISSRALSIDIAGSLAITNGRAVKYAGKVAARYVREVSDATKVYIRRLIVRGFTEGRTVATTQADIAKILAKRAKATLGLTARQYATVEKARATLASRAEVQSSARSGTDARVIAAQTGLTDSQVAAALRKPRIDVAQIDARIERIAARALRRRSRTIARTETINASTAGQREVWRQAQERGIITFDTTLATHYETPVGQKTGPTAHPNCRCAEGIKIVDGIARRFWIVTPDDRLCAICAAIPEMNPDGVGLAEEEDDELRMEAA